LSAFEGAPTFLFEEGLFSGSFINEEVDMRLIALKIVALLTAIANVAAFGGSLRPW
jgi:hypothetical protein